MTIAFLLGCMLALIVYAAWTHARLAQLETREMQPGPLRLGPHPINRREASYLILYRIAWGRTHSRNYMRTRYGLSAYSWNKGHSELKRLKIWDGKQLLMTYAEGQTELDSYFRNIADLKEKGQYVSPY